MLHPPRRRDDKQMVEVGGRIERGTPKTESGVRRVPVSRAVEAALREHAARMDRLADEQGRPPSSLMFPSTRGTPLTPRTVYRARDVLIADLGLPYSTLHQMRKVWTSYLTLDLIRQGRYNPKLVSKLFGHNDPRIALEVHTLVADDELMGSFFDLPAPPEDDGL